MLAHVEILVNFGYLCLFTIHVNFYILAYFKDGVLFHERACKTVVKGPIYLMDNEYFLDKNFRIKIKVETLDADSRDDSMIGKYNSFNQAQIYVHAILSLHQWFFWAGSRQISEIRYLIFQIRQLSLQKPCPKQMFSRFHGDEQD